MSKSNGNGLAAPKPIPAKSVLRVEDLGELLGVPQAAIDAEAKAGRLRVAKVAGMRLVLGAWVSAWLEATAAG